MAARRRAREVLLRLFTARQRWRHLLSHGGVPVVAPLRVDGRRDARPRPRVHAAGTASATVLGSRDGNATASDTRGMDRCPTGRSTSAAATATTATQPYLPAAPPSARTCCRSRARASTSTAARTRRSRSPPRCAPARAPPSARRCADGRRRARADTTRRARKLRLVPRRGRGARAPRPLPRAVLPHRARRLHGALAHDRRRRAPAQRAGQQRARPAVQRVAGGRRAAPRPVQCVRVRAEQLGRRHTSGRGHCPAERPADAGYPAAAAQSLCKNIAGIAGCPPRAATRARAARNSRMSVELR